MTIIGVAALAALIGIPLGILIIGVGGGRGRQRSWIGDRNLARTPAVVDLVEDYLTRRRRLRWACAVLALVGVNVVTWLVAGVIAVQIDLLPLMGTYVVGTVLAELTLTRPSGEAPTASLTERTLDQYLTPGWRSLQLAMAVVAVVAWASLFGAEPRPEGEVQVPSATIIAIYAGVAVAVVAFAELAQRAIVRRPQSTAAPDLLGADDAIRSDSVHAIAGATIGFLVIWTGGPLLVWTQGAMPSVVATVVGLLLWMRCARTIRPVRRGPVDGGAVPAFGP